MQTIFWAQLRSILGISTLALSMVVALPAVAASKSKTNNNLNRDRIAQRSEIAPQDDTDTSDYLGLSPSAQLPSSMEAGMAGDGLSNFGPSSGTVVGNRAVELRDEVLRLRAAVSLDTNEFTLLRANGAAGAVQYHSTVAAITARLQNGTTRGNPILLRQWDEAEASLNEVTTSLNRLNSLQNTVAADASLSGYLLESIQAAFQLSGAIDEDHDQLKLLKDEVSRLVVQLDYLSNQITDDLQRQTAYATTERANIQTLAYSINRGELMSNSSTRPVIVNPSPVMSMPPQQQSSMLPPPMGSFSPTGGFAPTPAAAPVAPVGSQDIGATNPDVGYAPSTGRLLVLIRYNKPVVEYEQQLSTAISSALDRRPNAEFSVVAVTPTSGDSSELAKAHEVAGRNAEAVKRSLTQLGIAASRITMANTQTQTAQSPEVHVYVR